MKNINDLKTRSELADYLGISRRRLTYILFIKTPDSYYQTFDIPKASGGVRNICAPTGILKRLQTILAKRLWLKYVSDKVRNKIENTNISHAFEKRKSIITNARIHRNKRYVINLDLENFFDSFHFGRVLGYFEKNKNFMLPHEVAVALTQLVCYQKHLPQGAPTSPIITNLICQILDFRLLKIAKKYKLNFTRYADDLTFSTNDKKFLDLKEHFFKEITTDILRAGFSVNNRKTRIEFKDSRQEVTGLTVNKKVSIKREYVQNTRAMAHHLYTQGHFSIDGQDGDISQLEGRFSFINQLDVYNNRLLLQFLKIDKNNDLKLNKREKEYQKFLFYKYFYANEKPLIVTEGKTDVLYLKAALQNLYARYPELIEKNDKGHFSYKIAFFNRSDKWERLFKFVKDGADSIKNLYFCFSEKNNSSFPNYFKYFLKLSNEKQKNSVILLFDNEIDSENKPLKKFLGVIKASNDAKDTLRTSYTLQLIPDGKLFLVTNPLAVDKKESEIEDLFPVEVLNIKIEGKVFCRDDKFDKTKYYGKHIFSKYVYKNYKMINFTGFIPLLDVIRSITVNLSDQK
ncbi:MAG: retron Ec67 family RNA-directed DNA polymerase/endonuclease [Acidaminococcaceae bacterium]|nr:retron Ec67 family RNA-directed DNA polymerase/endonuclease [Acidaminococcaceae bacterium]